MHSFLLSYFFIFEKREIYWPGSGVDVLEFDLFEVGDDVVFGSRSVVKCSNENEMKKVKLKKGANVADRCFITPGVTVGMFSVSFSFSSPPLPSPRPSY
jgi:acetyltransferase-like isoleucine patch superfamily enzyme